MVWTQAKIPNLERRTAVVTGANGALGYETAITLAAAGAHVIMAARDQAKAQAAKTNIEALHPQASLEIVELDLGNLESVALAANAIAVNHRKLDILINNAGLMVMPERKTVDGFEMQFGVNHLGHWAMTAQLMPLLLVTAGSRVVTVTSTARHICFKLNEKNPHLEGEYRPWKAYGQAKLANYHFGIGLQRKLSEAGVSTMSLVAHPGLSNTNLQTHTVSEGVGGKLGSFFHQVTEVSGMPPAKGVRPLLRAATEPGIKGGTLFAPRFMNSGPAVKVPVTRRLGMGRSIDRLWRVSERETGISIDHPRSL
jgi:NAD(P)-dependent dehydrogenase (short-subunit alcohol dehydrogenase family)